MVHGVRALPAWKVPSWAAPVGWPEHCTVAERPGMTSVAGIPHAADRQRLRSRQPLWHRAAIMAAGRHSSGGGDGRHGDQLPGQRLATAATGLTQPATPERARLETIIEQAQRHRRPRARHHGRSRLQPHPHACPQPQHNCPIRRRGHRCPGHANLALRVSLAARRRGRT
jgi:hypothetical protein